jgi:hypothetical protein
MTGSPGVIVLSRDAGVGKSTVLARFARSNPDVLALRDGCLR